MNPTETKAIPVSQQMEGPHLPNKKKHKKQAIKTEPEKTSQSTKLSVVHEKKSQEGKPKEHTEAPVCVLSAKKPTQAGIRYRK
ncbi:CAST isoform 24 [Pongo abelii]|uniref:CAST isoform 24 n=1 Tax=Pongo abelii TaxID=9601 RepID=A0A2J8TDD1_PONAB|nr:CAST isoform 24 [Pongo abelii]